MATYLIQWHANPDNWPTDPAEVLATWEGALGGGDAQLAAGGFREIGFLTNSSGYCIAEAESKAEVVGLCTPFFPFFSQTIEEIVPWEDGRDAILATARAMAGAR